VFLGKHAKKFPADCWRRIEMRLNRIDAAVVLEDLRCPPSHHLEALRGDRVGQHSIRVNKQWRVCFVWHEGNAMQIEVVDYH